MAKKKKTLTLEEKLQEAPVSEKVQPYPVPRNWCWTRLGNISEIIMGQSPLGSSTTDDDRFTPLIGGAADMGDLYPSVTRYTKKPTKLSTSDDLIVCIRATLGKPVYSDGEYCLGRGVAGIRSKLVDKAYLRYYFLDNENYLFNNATGSTFLQVTGKTLNAMPFSLPPLPEQQRIVDRIESLFAKLDEAEEKAQAVIDGYEERKAAILHKAFTGELTKKWREENKITLDSWNTVFLKDVCQINPKKIDTKDLSDELKVSFFPMASLSEEYGEITDPQIRELGEVKKGFTNFMEGDVVFAKITPCMENGKSAVIGELVNGIGYGTTEFFVLRCGMKLSNRYLYHLLRDKNFRGRAKSVMSGAVGQQRVPKKFLENYQLYLPTLKEQKVIVTMLDECFHKEHQIKLIAESTLNQIDTMKKSILAKAFRGELGTNDPEELSSKALLKGILAEEV